MPLQGSAPLAEPRLSLDADGLVVYQLKHAFLDGTTHVPFEPIDFIARLAALVPRPRAHLIGYHGLFTPMLATDISSCPVPP